MPKLSDYLKMTDEQLAEEGITRAEVEYMQEEHETALTDVEALNNINKKLAKISKSLSGILDAIDTFVEIQTQEVPDMDLIEEKMDELEELELAGDNSQEGQAKIVTCVAEMLQELKRSLGRTNEPDNNA